MYTRPPPGPATSIIAQPYTILTNYSIYQTPYRLSLCTHRPPPPPPPSREYHNMGRDAVYTSLTSAGSAGGESSGWLASRLCQAFSGYSVLGRFLTAYQHRKRHSLSYSFYTQLKLALYAISVPADPAIFGNPSKFPDGFVRCQSGA